MKQFKKRWRAVERNCLIKVDCFEGDLDCKQCKIIQEAAYRAALEWVLKDLYRNQYGQGMDSLAQQIREELGDE